MRATVLFSLSCCSSSDLKAFETTTKKSISLETRCFTGSDEVALALFHHRPPPSCLAEVRSSECDTLHLKLFNSLRDGPQCLFPPTAEDTNGAGIFRQFHRLLCFIPLRLLLRFLACEASLASPRGLQLRSPE